MSTANINLAIQTVDLFDFVYLYGSIDDDNGDHFHKLVFPDINEYTIFGVQVSWREVASASSAVDGPGRLMYVTTVNDVVHMDLKSHANSPLDGSFAGDRVVQFKPLVTRPGFNMILRKGSFSLNYFHSEIDSGTPTVDFQYRVQAMRTP